MIPLKDHLIDYLLPINQIISAHIYLKYIVCLNDLHIVWIHIEIPNKFHRLNASNNIGYGTLTVFQILLLQWDVKLLKQFSQSDYKNQEKRIIFTFGHGF